MMLKVNDTCDFSIALNLNVNYDLEKIELTVTAWNKRKHTTQTKTFPAAEFSQALAYYNQQEKLLGSGAEKQPKKKCCYNCHHSRHFYAVGKVVCLAGEGKLAEDEGDPILLGKSCEKFCERGEDDDIGNTLC